MHRALASSDTTFGAMLINARTHTAIRMLSSPLFRRISTAEVGRRAGFLSASHFLRVIRKRTGMTPPQLRRNAAP
jgi:AraC family transcriptional activator of tynA and feaB